MVSGGGSVAELDSWGGGDAECPFVVPLDDKFLLFRNIEYGQNNLNVQYCSDDPLNFGVETGCCLLGNQRMSQHAANRRCSGE